MSGINPLALVVKIIREVHDQQDTANLAMGDDIIHRILDERTVQDDDDNDDDYAAVFEPNQNDDNEPPTRREGEGVLDFLERFSPYYDSPLRVRGESNADYRARQDRHQERMEELYQAALTPADHAFLYNRWRPQAEAAQILEDAEEAAEELAMGILPQPPATPERLLELEAMRVRVLAALALQGLE